MTTRAKAPDPMGAAENRRLAARRLAEFLRAHAAREDELLDEYQALSAELPTPAMRYLARLILADEQRHQMIFGDLAETVCATDDLKARGMPILDNIRVTDEVVRQQTLQTLDQFILREDQERSELAALVGALAPSEASELWTVLLELIAQDTQRHLSLLEFLRDRML